MPLYEGDEPFIFISYAHKDRRLVLPYIRRLEEMHYRVWYDKEIRTGTSQWAPVIQQHLKHCRVMIVFLTNSYLESENCSNELEYARNNIGYGYIHLLRMQELDEELLDSTGFSLNFARAHILPADRMRGREILAEICRGLGIDECLEDFEEDPFEFYNEPKDYIRQGIPKAEPEQNGFAPAIAPKAPELVTAEEPEEPEELEIVEVPEVPEKPALRPKNFFSAVWNSKQPPVIATKVFCEFLVFGLLVILLTYVARSEWLEVHPLWRIVSILADISAVLCGLARPLASCEDVETWYRETYGIETPMEHPLEWKFMLLSTVIPGCMMLWAKLVLRPQSIVLNILWWIGSVILGVVFLLGLIGLSVAKTTWDDTCKKK